MKLAIWKTGHQIADTIAEAVIEGCLTQKVEFASFNTGECVDFSDIVKFYDIHIGYGILRGMGDVFLECKKQSKHWFNIDNGYWGAGHYGGNYRINYRGTQSQWSDNIHKEPHSLLLENWKPFDKKKTILVCPPSEYVCDFFKFKRRDWIANKKLLLCAENYLIREKSESSPIEWDGVKGVITFNSTVGVEALRRGIPVISDMQHSIIGSYYKKRLVENNLDYSFENVIALDRSELFNGMSGQQIKLAKIKEGKAWTIIKHLIR